MNTGLHSTAFSFIVTRVFVTTLLVLGIQGLFVTPANGQGSHHFTILQEQQQNFERLMGKIESLGLTDTEYAHALENAMASALRDDGFMYYSAISQAKTEFLKLEQSDQMAILDVLAQLSVPADSPMHPSMICGQCCMLTCASIWCTGACWCYCWYGYAICYGEGDCTIPVQSNTWGAIKVIYGIQDGQL